MMLRRAWPPVYTTPAVVPAPLPPPDYYYADKGKEYYFLAPLYRDALPPPPRRPPPTCPCSCLLLAASRRRSRSLDTVPSEVNASDGEGGSDDGRSAYGVVNAAAQRSKRRSMENLIDTNTARTFRKYNARVSRFSDLRLLIFGIFSKF